MDTLVITGIPGYDGEYDFDASYFTNKELHTIKRLAGVRAAEIQDAFAAGDNDLVVAFAAVALERGGKVVVDDVLWNARVGCIELKLGEREPSEDDALPPESAPPVGASESERKPSSGPPSSDGSDHQGNGQSRTGLQPSELSPA